MKDVVKVMLAITTVALIGTLVVNATGSAAVIKAVGGAFQQSIGTATSGGK